MCGCEINDLMKKETSASILIYPPWPQPLCSSDPPLSPDHLSGFISARSCPSSLSARAHAFRELTAISDALPLPKFHRMRIRC